MTQVESTTAFAPPAERLEGAAPGAWGGTLPLAGYLTVRRMGFGSMQLTGRGVWGEPADHGAAIAVLQRAVELGGDFIDRAGARRPAGESGASRRTMARRSRSCSGRWSSASISSIRQTPTVRKWRSG